MSVHPACIEQKVDNSIAIVKKREELSIKYHFSSKETEDTLVPYIIWGFPMWGSARFTRSLC